MVEQNADFLEEAKNYLVSKMYQEIQHNVLGGNKRF